MPRLIRVISGISLLIVILLIVMQMMGRLLGSSTEMIAFQSQQGLSTDICLLDVHTRISHNLTRQPGRSQNAPRLLSVGDTAEYPTQPQHFINQGSDVSPALSPDGSRLAFVSYRDGNSEIYLLDVRTGQLHNLTNHPVPDNSPVWSPDGTQLVFESLRGGYWGIWLADLERGTIRVLTDHTYASQSPTWSPDGKRIVFQSKRGRYWDLYMIDRETGETRSLTNRSSDDLHPVWLR